MSQAGVIFDIDGVLVDSYVPHLRSWCLLAEEVGRPISEEQFAATFGKTSRDIISELFGVEEEREVRRMDDRKEAIYRDMIRGRIPVMAGAVAAMEALAAAGYRLAVGSSGPPENVALVCEGLGLERLLSASVTGADVQRGKPDPQVFEFAAERMGLARASCVVVEDAPAGLEAARRAGMRCIGLVGSHDAAALAAGDAVVERLAQVCPELVSRLLMMTKD